MFDLHEYEYSTVGDIDSTTGALDIDEDLSAEIEAIFKSRFNKLYASDLFKRGNHTVEILYPALGQPGSHSLTKGPNHVRFLLSLYPYASDLENVAKIILKPRYIEQDNIEIIALYLRSKKILVQYLHHPFYYETTGLKFHEYSEFTPIDLSRVHNTHLAVKSPTPSLKTLHIPPLWYVLSIIESSNDGLNEGLIDKFFLRREGPSNSRLAETSFYYSRHGY
jgi:hypothetical protein